LRQRRQPMLDLGLQHLQSLPDRADLRQPHGAVLALGYRRGRRQRRLEWKQLRGAILR
jgi:hypothetical protein